MSASDYSAFQPTAEDKAGDLAKLSALAYELQEREKVVALAEAALKVEEAKLRELSSEKIPELMETLGLKEITLNDGSKLSVKDVPKCSISGPKNSAAIAWLEQRGDGGLVKRMLSVFFPREKQDQAKVLLESLRKTYDDVGEKYWVEPGTLLAHLKELKKQGVPFPEETFGWFERKETKIVGPKG